MEQLQVCKAQILHRSNSLGLQGLEWQNTSPYISQRKSDFTNTDPNMIQRFIFSYLTIGHSELEGLFLAHLSNIIKSKTLDYSVCL